MVQKTGFLSIGSGLVLLSTSAERKNNFEKSQLIVEIETEIKYMEPGGEKKLIANGVLGNMCCQMEVQLITDEWKNGEEFTGEAASENRRWVDATAWSSSNVEKE